MTFYDPKERVLELQLTRYGRYLLSKGEFEPVGYDFFDDDVLYDVASVGDSEIQNHSETRILEETPRLEVQTVFESGEKEIKKLRDAIREEDPNISSFSFAKPVPITNEKKYFQASPLGTSDISKEYVPAWRVDVQGGEISGTVQYQSVDVVACQRIPQINLKDSEYRVVIRKGNPSAMGEEGAAVPRPGNIVFNADKSEVMITDLEFQDGSFIETHGKNLYVNLQEINATRENELFEMEVFLVETDNDGVEELTPLSFAKKQEIIKDGILLDKPEGAYTPENEIDSTFVEYYFDLWVDHEIIEEKEIKPSLVKKGTNKSGPFGDNC